MFSFSQYLLFPVKYSPHIKMTWIICISSSHSESSILRNASKIGKIRRISCTTHMSFLPSFLPLLPWWHSLVDNSPSIRNISLLNILSWQREIRVSSSLSFLATQRLGCSNAIFVTCRVGKERKGTLWRRREGITILLLLLLLFVVIARILGSCSTSN